jgi:mono/diheme cytochrome c family protein
MRSLILVALLVSACSKNDTPPPPSSGTPNARPETGPRPTGGDQAAMAGGPSTEGQKMFATVCATCHGADGSGNGPAAESLNPKPRNYTDAEWQKSVTDDDIKKIILEGGQAVGKSPMMPAQSQLKDKPEVVNELVAIIRGFAKK